MILEGDYRRDGAVCVRQAFSDEHLRWATEAIEANLADLSPLAKRASSQDDGAFVRISATGTGSQRWNSSSASRLLHGSPPP